MENRGEILIYQMDDNETNIEVLLKEDTVWLNQNQMVQLFNSSKANISEHIKAVFNEGELQSDSTVRKFRTVQIEGSRNIKRNIEHYSLDVIISVGYRVKSKRGTQFRIWANKILKEYLISGYSLNQKLLKIKQEKLEQLNRTIKLISSITLNEHFSSEKKDLFIQLLDTYSTALNILDDYDYNRFHEISVTSHSVYVLEYNEVCQIINRMKETVGNSRYFGKEKDESLKSSISTIYQTFEGKDLYPSIEEKAANLLYFIVKNHSFVDGNKRIAAGVFLYFLERNNILNQMNLNNNLLVALTLMTANSNPSEKDLLVNIISVLLKESSI